MKMRTSDLECIGDRLHREASFGCDKSRKLGFFDSDFARASRKISTSIVLRPSIRSSSRTRSSSRRTSELPTTGSSDPTAAAPPSVINRRQRYSRLGATPRRRATDDTVCLTGLEALLDDLQLLLGRPMPPANRAGDQFDTLVVVRHKPVLEDSLKPSRLCRVSVRTGGQSTKATAVRCKAVFRLPHRALSR